MTNLKSASSLMPVPYKRPGRSIIIGLIEHLGDIVACEPVVRYLRASQPNAHITWAVSTPYRELIDYNPHVDETLVIDCLTDWIKLTKHGTYDRIVDLHVNFRVCQHCRVPLVKTTGNPFVNVYEWFDYGNLLQAFSTGAGLPALSGQPLVYLRDEHRLAVDALGLPERYCVVHLESNNVDKDWKPEKWSALLARIAGELDLPIVAVGAGRSTSGVTFPEGSVSLFNKVPILQAAEVIRRASVFVGIDSGPAHLANAVRAPSVVLLGKLGYFQEYTPFSGHLASDAATAKLVRSMMGPVSDLTVDEVWEAVRYVVAVAAHRPPPPAAPAALEIHEADRVRILDSGMFDPGWYAAQYEDVLESGLSPLDHYLAIGGMDHRSPGPRFDVQKYLARYPDIAAASVNPLLHYLGHGKLEGRIVEPHEVIVRRSRNGHWRAEAVVPDAMPPAASVWPSVASSVPEKRSYPRNFAFYLPQFHPIAENDWAHGPGFSEWHNVVKAKPLFAGHYQPRIPGELGYYDLRTPEIIERQVELAQAHGIDGFCFYYYYFGGKKLLYRPIQNYISSGMSAPFFFLWANENWSKRWDGGDREVIIAQKHSPEDSLAFINELLPIFEDSRYVKIGGKPLLMIYKAHLFADVRAATELWRRRAEEHGFPGLHLVLVDDWSLDPCHPRELGFDASYEIPSNIVYADMHKDPAEVHGLTPDFDGRIVDYARFARFHAARPFPAYKRFRTVMLPWDNTPRYGTRAMVHVNGDTEAYRNWLIQALLDTTRKYEPEERIVLLHSWNEWCEGTYLEPDGKRGRFFLEETAAAVRLVRQAIDLSDGTPEQIALVANLFQAMSFKDEGALRLLLATHQMREAMPRFSAQASVVDDMAMDQVSRLRSEVAAAQAHLEAMHRSTSWRVTAPLRRLKLLLGS